MKRIVSVCSMVAWLGPVACKHKDNAPPPTASAVVAAAASGVSSPSAPSDQAPFEGEIGLRASGKLAGNDSAPLDLTLRIKDGKLRVDLPESLTKAQGVGTAYLLVQPTEKKAYAVLEAKKQAVLLELDKLAEQAKAFGARGRPPGTAAGTAPSAPPHLEKTGRADTVAGIKCDIWHISHAKVEGDACIAEQTVSWFQLPPSLGQAPTELAWLSQIADGKHLPLRFVTIEKSVERGRVEVTRVERTPLVASLFEVPADYPVINLEQMVAAMLGGFGGAGLPSGLALPPGVKLPPGLKVPPRTAPASGK